MTIPGLLVTLLGMVGDLDDHKISSVQKFSSVQNFMSLGAVEAYNSYNGVGRELVREGHFVCCLELLRN